MSNSTPNEKKAIRFTSERRSRVLMTLFSVLTASSVPSPMRDPKSNTTSVDMVMMPRPPSWAKAMIAICPVKVQCVAVSTTDRPVTQIADVAVKSAWTSEVGSFAMTGSIRMAVPRVIAIAKAVRIVRPGVAAPRMTPRCVFTRGERTRNACATPRLLLESGHAHDRTCHS